MRGGYIVFKHQKPLNHLLKHGVVYTLRWMNRTQGLVTLKTSKSGNDIGIVKVEYVGKLIRHENGWKILKKDGNIVPLKQFVSNSGFRDEEDWILAFLEIAKRRSAVGARLYKVTLEKLYYYPLDGGRL